MDTGAPRSASRVSIAAGVVLITLLALGLRLYQIERHSAWVDEYSVFGRLAAPDLKTFHALIDFFAADNLPVYITIQYFYGKLVGTSSIPVLRLLSIIPGILCIPLLFRITLLTYGKRAAFIAALLAALSPIHIWLSQLARQNSLIEMFVLLAVLSMIHATRERKFYWWLLNAASNLAAVWLSAFVVFAFIPQGLYILWRYRKSWKPVLAWGTANFLIAASPSIILLPVVANVQTASEDFFMTIPPLFRLLADFFADDAVMTSDPFAFQGMTWPFLHVRLQDFIVSMHPWFDGAMVFAFATVSFWVLARLARSVFQRPSETAAPGAHPAQSELLLLLMAFVPLTVLLVLSLTWRPCILARYTSYSPYALYAMAGGAICAVRNKDLRRILFGGLLLLYGYQLSVSLPATTRTNWNAAAELVRVQAKPDDVILVKGIFFSREIFRFAFKDSGTATVTPAFTLNEICDVSVRVCTGSRRVWALIEPFVFTLPPFSDFEDTLRAQGLTLQRTAFPGMNGVFVYRIERDTRAAPEAAVRAQITAPKFDPTVLLTDLYETVPDEPERSTEVHALSRAWDAELPPSRYFYTQLAMQLAFQGELTLAERVQRRALEMDPDFPFALFVLAIILGERGDYDAGIAAFREAVQADRDGFVLLFESAYGALYRDKDYVAARTRFQEMDRWGTFIPYVMLRRAGLLPAL